MKARILYLSLATLAAAALIGCSEEPTRPASQQAPTLPPAETMDLDLSFFGGGAALAARPSEIEGSMNNYINAAVRVTVINILVAHAVTPPALAFQAAIHTKPVLQDDGWFLWTYAFTGGDGHHVTIRLRGRIDGDQVTWELRVTDPQASPALNDFLWFSGRSRINNEYGYWVFNEPQGAQGVPVVRIDWTIQGPTRRQLVFTNITAGSPGSGDRLEYRLDEAIISVLFHDESENVDADITWNRVTGTGSLMVPDYNNGERACWDERQQDTVCPEPAA